MSENLNTPEINFIIIVLIKYLYLFYYDKRFNVFVLELKKTESTIIKWR